MKRFKFDYRNCLKNNDYLHFENYIDENSGELNVNFEPLIKSSICCDDRVVNTSDSIFGRDYVNYYRQVSSDGKIHLNEWIDDEDVDFIGYMKSECHIYLDTDKEPLTDGYMVSEEKLVNVVEESTYREDCSDNINNFVQLVLSDNGVEDFDYDEDELGNRFLSFCIDFYCEWDYGLDYPIRDEFLNRNIMHDEEPFEKLQLLVHVENFFNKNKYFKYIPTDTIYVFSPSTDSLIYSFSEGDIIYFRIEYDENCVYECEESYKDCVEERMTAETDSLNMEELFGGYESLEESALKEMFITIYMSYIIQDFLFNHYDKINGVEYWNPDEYGNNGYDVEYNYIDKYGFIADIENQDDY